ncbi:(2Fe-2S) ferredoxin domain-containing protein [Streptomyces sp. SID3343]|uniref:(2Fe-2S) ferredoxin domain-containing protein n=1 Tax=Streptomyces sp. SID3343 TaxID=2690260 RepID=UPI001369911F|nr:(2Fe-2S) ferredoxin domain-containing protein [Streptomyces sp. SID3343]MYW04123.1 (2Fe-2S) ferredoxin domain-containing protein [Streptomyces sp. SID3343]
MGRRRSNTPTAPTHSAPCTVTVCRGCCCGTAKVAAEDHAAQVSELRGALADTPVTVRLSDCLGPCERGNVIVVQPSAAGRAAGGRPAWFGTVNDPDATGEIAAWAAAGGPGVEDAPGLLGLYAFTPNRKARQGIDGGT